MSYAQPFLRLVCLGQLCTTEAFSYSMSLVSAPGSTPNAPEEVPPEIISAFATFHATTGLMSQNALMTTLKLNLLGTDGKYVNPETVLYEYPTPVAGGAGGGPAPQIAYAVSLATDAQRGRASRGRFYLPVPVATVGPTGQISTTAQTSISVAATNLLQDINDALVPWRLGVVSNLGAGAQRYVTGARYGRVLDTIRSRRTSIAEEYTDTVITA